MIILFKHFLKFYIQIYWLIGYYWFCSETYFYYTIECIHIIEQINSGFIWFERMYEADFLSKSTKKILPLLSEVGKKKIQY